MWYWKCYRIYNLLWKSMFDGIEIVTQKNYTEWPVNLCSIFREVRACAIWKGYRVYILLLKSMSDGIKIVTQKKYTEWSMNLWSTICCSTNNNLCFQVLWFTCIHVVKIILNYAIVKTVEWNHHNNIETTIPGQQGTVGS